MADAPDEAAGGSSRKASGGDVPAAAVATQNGEGDALSISSSVVQARGRSLVRPHALGYIWRQQSVILLLAHSSGSRHLARAPSQLLQKDSLRMLPCARRARGTRFWHWRPTRARRAPRRPAAASPPMAPSSVCARWSSWPSPSSAPRPLLAAWGSRYSRWRHLQGMPRQPANRM